MAERFLIDTNVFVQAKNFAYRFDFCSDFWAWMEQAHHAGIVQSVRKVYAELCGHDKTDPARCWAENLPDGFFMDDEQDPRVMEHYAALMAWAAGSGQYYPKALTEFANRKNADPFLVAVAKLRGFTIVTHETASPEAKAKVPLPSAADHLGVPVLSVYDLLSRYARPSFKLILS